MIYFKIFILLIMLITPLDMPCAQEQPNEAAVKMIQGNVRSIDWPGSCIVVSFIDEKGSAREITLIVPDDVKIARGNEKIGLADVEVGDNLNIEYYDSSFEPFKAKSIIDNSLANNL